MEKVLLQRVQEYNPEIIRNIITEGMEEPGSKITITEKSGTGLPTSRMFRRAGYRCLKKQHRIKPFPIKWVSLRTIFKMPKKRVHTFLQAEKK